MHSSIRSTLRIAVLAIACAPGAWSQQEQASFSVDWQGVLQGTLSTGGVRITAGDVLGPEGGVPSFAAGTPEIRFTGGFLGIQVYGGCVGSGPGQPCIELDALSYGLDLPIPSAAGAPYRIWFTTDEYALGQSFLPPPSVASEAPFGDLCADLFAARDLGTLPVGPSQPPSHEGLVDGNGLPNPAGLVYRGLGVTEPNVPGSGFPNNPNDPGDNVDAMDVGPVPDPALRSIWFSLDGNLFDPFSQTQGAATAQAQGAAPGDVLRRLPGGGVVVYATANELGLDRNGPPNSDDLDALILAENGIDGYQRSTSLFDWEAPLLAPTDMLLFSVRRGSAVIGALDSLQGLPIMEGDLLAPPIAGGNGNPAIVVAAEALGLQTTRSGGFPDEMNGADARLVPVHDCNKNNIEDAEDIADGTSQDDNKNGVPDECEKPGTRYCFCPAGGECGSNPDPDSGCANSTGVGADLEGAGSSSVYLDDLVLTTTNARPNQFGLVFMGPATGSAFMGAGIRCVAPGAVGLFRFPPKPTGPSGSFSIGPGIVAKTCDVFPPEACIEVGATWHFQSWYRDSSGPCGKTSNVSNALAVTFTD